MTEGRARTDDVRRDERVDELGMVRPGQPGPDRDRAGWEWELDGMGGEGMDGWWWRW